MNPKLRQITETAAMLAILIALQTLTKPLGQLVTGSCVNMVLAISVLVGGLGSGVIVALASPVLAFLLGIAPQILTVPAIMLGNLTYVLILHAIAGRKMDMPRRIAAWLTSAAAKFAVLYATVTWVICGVLAQTLLDAGLMKAAMLTALPATFSWPQLYTALVGGAVALTAAPLIRQALKK